MLYPQQNQYRQVCSLDGFWKFTTDPEGDGVQHRYFDGLDTSRELAVPGSWNEQHLDLYDYFGIGWYEKEIVIPHGWEGRRVWLRIGSACFNAVLYVNGQKAAEHTGPHLPFEADITELVRLGEANRVTVMVDGRLDPWCLPPAIMETNEGREGFFNCNPAVSYDFYPYVGIHRSVLLYTTDPVHVEDVTVTADMYGHVSYTVRIAGEGAHAVRVSTDGQSNIHPLAREISGSFTIEDPRLWDVGQPNLYELTVEVGDVDAYTVSYGLRSVEIRGDQFMLNGKPVLFKGFGKHEDFFVLGKGYNPNLVVKDFALLDWVGANSFRTSHYPYAEELMDYADRHGMLVIDETPFVGLNERMYTPEVLERAKGIIAELLTRDKNHPCVVMWSVANEPRAKSDAAMAFFKGMADTVRALDATRPVTYVVHLGAEDNPPLEYFDVVCVNKYFGWYELPGDAEGGTAALKACLDGYYETYHKPVLITEFGADAIDGMHRLPAEMFSEEYQADILLRQYRLAKSLPYCIGTHVWAFADFKTAQSTSRVIVNRKGVFTRERMPKLAAHALRREWKE